MNESQQVVQKSIKKYTRVELKEKYLNSREEFIKTAKKTYDSRYGGFGTDKKFPMAPTIDYLIDEYRQNRSQELLAVIKGTLDGAMKLFDSTNGGFYSYAMERDWTSPHNEKEISVNSQLNFVYSKMGKLGVSKTYEELSKLSANYIIQNFYDPTIGGFYASASSKTKYAKLNAEAITNFVNSGQKTIEALNSLNFMLGNMLTVEGVFHYHDGSSAQHNGQLLDNAWLLRALIAVEHKNAGELADFIVEQFYDETTGAFNEQKHSQEKLPESNGVVAYCLLKLGTHTNEAETALSYFIGKPVQFDKKSYLLRASMML